MPYRRSRGKYYTRRTPRGAVRTQWIRTQGLVDAAGVGSTDSLNLLGSAGGGTPQGSVYAYSATQVMPEETVVTRCFIELAWSMDSTGLGKRSFVGVGIFTNEDVVTSATLPQADAEANSADWMWWGVLDYRNGLYATTGTTPTVFASKTIDIRAKRKARNPLMSLYIINSADATAGGQTLAVAASVLITVP